MRAPERDDELGRLGRAFNRMTERLEQADARQREFLADVAHELRTPVTSIEGFAQALDDGTARTEEDRREAAEFIRAEAAACASWCTTSSSSPTSTCSRPSAGSRSTWATPPAGPRRAWRSTPT